ncbi:MAG: 3-oxoacyl-[acyl-carrier-protein] reductase [Deltaproteobacteria bacterium]|nr:3-oxoacyl-[acyl-carrier-protein] reductase [Deltaproteobacteria bacterium]
MKLEGKVALITGAGRGIGRAIALELAGEGADLVVADISQGPVDETRAEIEALGRKALALVGDVTSLESMEQVTAKALESFSRIDILVNNAGITKDNLFMRMSGDEWKAVMSVNLDGVFNSTRPVVKTMIKQRSGRIINISSVVGFSGNPGQVNYSSTKAALMGFTKSLARELGSRGVTCNAVAPGFIQTDMTDKLADEHKKALLSQIPLGRMGSAQDIAKAVSFLASDDAGYITGTVIHVNGGMY